MMRPLIIAVLSFFKFTRGYLVLKIEDYLFESLVSVYLVIIARDIKKISMHEAGCLSRILSYMSLNKDIPDALSPLRLQYSNELSQINSRYNLVMHQRLIAPAYCVVRSVLHVDDAICNADECKSGVNKKATSNQNDSFFKSIFNKIASSIFYSSVKFSVITFLRAKEFINSKSSLDRNVDGISSDIFLQGDISLPNPSDTFAILSSFAMSIVSLSVIHGIMLFYFLGASSSIAMFTITDFVSSNLKYSLLVVIFSAAITVVIFILSRIKSKKIKTTEIIYPDNPGKNNLKHFIFQYSIPIICLSFSVFSNEPLFFVTGIFGVALSIIMTLNVKILNRAKIHNKKLYHLISFVIVSVSMETYNSYHNAFLISQSTPSNTNIQFSDNSLDKYSKSKIINFGSNFLAVFDENAHEVVTIQRDKIISIKSKSRDDKWLAVNISSVFSNVQDDSKDNNKASPSHSP